MDEGHPWQVDAALLGVICIIAITLGLVAHKMTQHDTTPPVRYCQNDTGFHIRDDIYADPGFPEYVPCKLLKQEQDV